MQGFKSLSSARSLQPMLDEAHVLAYACQLDSGAALFVLDVFLSRSPSGQKQPRSFWGSSLVWPRSSRAFSGRRCPDAQVTRFVVQQIFRTSIAAPEGQTRFILLDGNTKLRSVGLREADCTRKSLLITTSHLA